MEKIGFIGLGNMGAPMAHNLLKAGHQVTVFDLNPRVVQQLVDAGAQSATSIATLAQAHIDILITMLPAAQHVKQVYLGEDGILAHVAKGVLLIDSSTIDPHSARQVEQAAQAHGNPMVDAPVSGGTAGAQAGTLTFMVGSDDATFAKVQPILAHMGKNIVHCGAAGTGQVAKVANNLLLGISMIGLSEAMNLGVALGMDAKVLAQVINSSSGRCWSSELYQPYPGVMDNVPSARGYTGGFGSDLMLKDLGLAAESARLAKQPLMLGALAQQLYQTFSSQGNGHLDFSAIVQLYQNKDTAQ
ncbi:3-hydroxyisobutyrate dehydrogenase [Alkanindiges sp. WGS2144]|uniref:3-hydroxyisobutyrate dehydrogenase n=1 Tax=Alkanindiges sp. WGS2144 TaxID=3366808 RepID=UPI0037525C31